MSYTNGLDNPELYFNTLLYTGNDADDRNITGVGFNPDWVWIKSRNARGHQLYDVVRGANKGLATESTNAEDSDANIMQSFITDGFQVGSSAESNSDGANYVSWNWLANNTSGSSNTDGSITSTVSANTTSGFSIVSYTGNGTAGATVGHGLGTAPSLIIQKNRDSVLNWKVYHKSLGATKYINFDETNAAGTATVVWNDTEPTSSVYSLGSGNTNNSGEDYIAYCFAEKKSFSKFGSYTGNGNADGTFVYTGFKPAWLMVKKSSAAGDSWVIIDNTRFPYNYVDKFIYADEADAESGSAERLDFLSNGIKIRATHTFINTSGATYIYMAFAEAPFVNSNGVPCNAR